MASRPLAVSPKTLRSPLEDPNTTAKPKLKNNVLKLGSDDIEDGLDDSAHKDLRIEEDAMLRAARAAREELRYFGTAPTPHRDDCYTTLFFTLALLFYWFVAIGCALVRWVPTLCRCRGEERQPGFVESVFRLGGLEKVYTLLIIARFDSDISGSIDEEEKAEYNLQVSVASRRFLPTS